MNAFNLRKKKPFLPLTLQRPAACSGAPVGSSAQRPCQGLGHSPPLGRSALRCTITWEEAALLFSHTPALTGLLGATEAAAGPAQSRPAPLWTPRPASPFLSSLKATGHLTSNLTRDENTSLRPSLHHPRSNQPGSRLAGVRPRPFLCRPALTTEAQGPALSLSSHGPQALPSPSHFVPATKSGCPTP